MTRRLPALVATASTLMMMGCSTLIDVAGVPHAGAQLDGSYVPTSTEAGLDCGQLKGQVTTQIDRAKEISNAVADDVRRGPKTVVALFKQIAGTSSRGVKTIGEYDNARSRAKTLNELMRSKRCQTVDIDEQLSESDLIIAAARG